MELIRNRLLSLCSFKKGSQASFKCIFKLLLKTLVSEAGKFNCLPSISIVNTEEKTFVCS